MSFKSLQTKSVSLTNANSVYTRGAYVTLPTLPNSYSIPFSSTDYASVADSDAVTVDQTGDSTNTISAFLFKTKQITGSINDGTSFTWTTYVADISWVGQSTVATSTATITMEIYNYATGAWESLATDTTTASNTSLSLNVAAVAGDAAHFNPQTREMTVRVSQTTSTGTLSTDSYDFTFYQVATDPSGLAGYNIIRTISNTNDDTEEKNNTTLSTISAVDKIGNNNNNLFDLGLRFTNITIASGSTVTLAVLSIYVNAAVTSAQSFTIKGIKEANTASWTSTRPSQRTKTTASVNLTISPTDVGQIITTDLSAIVQEIINQGTWASGNAIGFVVLNTGNSLNQFIKINDSSSASPARDAQVGINYTAPAGGSSHASTRMMMGMGQ